MQLWCYLVCSANKRTINDPSRSSSFRSPATIVSPWSQSLAMYEEVCTRMSMWMEHLLCRCVRVTPFVTVTPAPCASCHRAASGSFSASELWIGIPCNKSCRFVSQDSMTAYKWGGANEKHNAALRSHGLATHSQPRFRSGICANASIKVLHT